LRHGAAARPYGLLPGSLNLAQFRLDFDFFAAGLGLFFASCFPRLQTTTVRQGFLRVMGGNVFGFNGKNFESAVTEAPRQGETG
jgi:hypothetical protein